MINDYCEVSRLVHYKKYSETKLGETIYESACILYYITYVETQLGTILESMFSFQHFSTCFIILSHSV